jgi:hypothetical protein
MNSLEANPIRPGLRLPDFAASPALAIKLLNGVPLIWEHQLVSCGLGLLPRVEKFPIQLRTGPADVIVHSGEMFDSRRQLQ